MKTLLMMSGLMLFAACPGLGQTSSVQLSPEHQAKLMSVESGRKRMLLYYKYYKKDSVRKVKKMKLLAKAKMDSLRVSENLLARLEKRSRKKGLAIPGKLGEVHRLTAALKRWMKVARDTAVSDSVRKIAKGHVRSLAVERAKLFPGFQNVLDKYQNGSDSLGWKDIEGQAPGMDTLRGFFDSSPQQVLETAGKSAEDLVKKYGSISAPGSAMQQTEQINSLVNQYKNQFNNVSDPDKLKGTAKEKAMRQGSDYFADHAGALQGAQQKVSKLMSKYRDFANSADLSGGVKQTSLKGKTFWEHLVAGSDFRLVAKKPVAADFLPTIGYRFNSRFFVGAGLNYRIAFTDTLRTRLFISPKNTAVKAFASYTLIRTYFAYAEAERTRIPVVSPDQHARAWTGNYFVGAGKRFLMHPKLYFTLTALYNLNHQRSNVVYPSRFQIRFGVQLSELAFRRKAKNYDPNR